MRKNKRQLWKKGLSMTLACAMTAAALPALPAKTAEAATVKNLLKAGAINAEEGQTTSGQPFAAGTGGSDKFRIPAFIVTKSGNLLAASDARYTTTGDGGGLDTIASVSTDDGATWNYSFPLYFPDSDGWVGPTATTIIDPALVQGEDGTIYCIADVNPTGVTTMGGYTRPHAGTGYVTVNGVQRMAITDKYANVDTEPTDNDLTTYPYYVGEFDEDGYAKILSRTDDSESGYGVDKWYNLYTVKNGRFLSNLTQKQVNTTTDIQQNAFYKGSKMHVYNTGYIMYAKTTDDGFTWSDPEIMNPQIKREKETALLVSPGQGLLTKDHTIVVPFYHNDNGAKEEQASIIWSDDNGTTWKRSNDVPGTSNGGYWSSESEAVELEDGTIRLFLRTGQGKICYADAKKDSNGDYVFSAPVNTGVTSTSTCNLTAITYSKKMDGKQVILLAAPTAGSDRRNGKIFTFVVNEDENHSLTLKNAYDVPNSASSYQYSCMSELKNGSIGLLWENGGASIKYDNFDIAQLTANAKIDDLELGVKLKRGDTYTRNYKVEEATGITQEPDANVAEVTLDTIPGETRQTVSMYPHVSNTGSSLDSFSGNADTSLDITDAEFTITGADNVYTIYNEKTGMYLTNQASAGTFFSTSSADMKITATSGSNPATFRICKNSSNNRYIIFYANNMDFNCNTNYSDGDKSYELVLLEKKDAAEDGDIVPGYKRVSEITSGKKYLISYIFNDRVIVLYPTNGTANQTKLLGDVTTLTTPTQCTLTVTGKGKGTTNAVVDGVIYHITCEADKRIELNEGETYSVDTADVTVQSGEDTVTLEKGKKVVGAALSNYSSAQNNSLSAFSTEVTNLDIANAEFVVTASGSNYSIQNPSTGKYLVHTNAKTYFNDTNSGQHSITAVNNTDGTKSFEIRGVTTNVNLNRYIYFFNEKMTFDGVDNKSGFTNRGDFAFEFLEKQDKVTAEDPIPGYKRASEIVSGHRYLITQFYKNGSEEGIVVLYPENGTANQTKLYRPVEGDVTTITAAKGGVADIVIDGEPYEVAVTSEAELLEKEKAELTKILTQREYKSAYNKGVQPEEYTETSWQVYKEAYETAQNADTREKVKAAKEALEAAMDQLKNVDVKISRPEITLPDMELGKVPGNVKTKVQNTEELAELADDTENPAVFTQKAGSTEPVYAVVDGEAAFRGQWLADSSNAANSKFDVYGSANPLILSFKLYSPKITGDAYLLGKTNSQYGLQFTGDANAEYLQMYTCTDNGVTWPTLRYALDDSFWNKWHDVVCIFTGSKMAFYVDGKQAVDRANASATEISATLKQWTDSMFAIGYCYGANDTSVMTEGYLADVKLYTTDVSENLTKSYADIVDALETTAPAADINVKPYTETTTWTKTGDENKVQGVFEADTDYTATTVLCAKEGYQFTAVNDTIAEERIQGTIQTSEDGKTLTITANYKAIEVKKALEAVIAEAQKIVDAFEGQYYKDDAATKAAFKEALKEAENKYNDVSLTDEQVTEARKTLESAIEAVNAKRATGIAITSEPTKKVYKFGEDFDATGMTVVCNYQNAETDTVTDSAVVTVSDFNSQSVGTQQPTLSVTYAGYTAKTVVNVEVLPQTYGQAKTYTADENGIITAENTEEELSFYNDLKDFTVTVTGKAQAGGKAYCLFTMEGQTESGTAKSFSVWYNPVDQDDTSKGSICFVTDSVVQGLVWNRKVSAVQTGKHFKATFSIAELKNADNANKPYYMLYSVNGTSGSIALSGNTSNVQWDHFGTDFLKAHNWKVTKVKIGEKPTTLPFAAYIPSSGAQLSFSDCEQGSIEKVVVINGVQGIEGLAKNYAAADAVTALQAANNETTEYTKWEKAIKEAAEVDSYVYTTESWADFQTAKNADITKESKDWVILDAKDELAAKAAALTKRTVKVTTTDENVTVSGNAGNYEIGEKVSLTAEAAEGYEFVYWLDVTNGKNTILSTENTLEFTADSNVTLKAVCRQKEAEKITATFKTSDRFGAVACGVLSGEAGKVASEKTPTAPKYIGYVFAGWAVDGNKKNLIDAGVDYTLPEKDVTLIAVYNIDTTEIEETYTVKVNGGTATAGGKVLAADDEVAFNTTVTVKAEEKEGQTFKNWTLDDGSVASTNETYSFLLKKDMVLTANYTTDEVTAKPSVALVLKERTRNGEKDKVRIGISWDNVSGYTILSEGMLRSYSAELGTAENLVLTNNSADIKNSKCPQVGNNGNYTVSVSLGATKVNSALYVRGYITYKDSNGNIFTAYTDVETLKSIR